jgi:hypothetical protein
VLSRQCVHRALLGAVDDVPHVPTRSGPNTITIEERW